MGNLEDSKSRNQRTITFLFIAALGYEILLKLSMLAFPDLFTVPGVKSVSMWLSILVGIIIVAFSYSVFLTLQKYKSLRIVLALLLVTMALNIITRIPLIRADMDFTLSRLLSYIFRFGISLLILFFFFFLHARIERCHRLFRSVIVISGCVFAGDAVFGLVRIGQFLHFMNTGIQDEPTSPFLGMMMVLFVVTRVAIIHFAWQWNHINRRLFKGEQIPTTDRSKP